MGNEIKPDWAIIEYEAIDQSQMGNEIKADWAKIEHEAIDQSQIGDKISLPVPALSFMKCLVQFFSTTSSQ